MPDSELAQWLQSRSFYTLLILAMLVVGLLLELVRRRKSRGSGSSPSPHRSATSPVKRRRGRPR